VVPEEPEASMKVVGLFKNAQGTLHVPAGGVVFKAGDTGSEMFGVVEGAIELRTSTEVIATIGPDEVFGEMAVVDSSPRMATAVATTETTLAVIDKRRFLFLVHETPLFALQVMGTLAGRLRAREMPQAPG